MSNNCTFIDGIDRLIYRWHRSPDALILISQEFIPYSGYNPDKIVLQYILLMPLNNEGLKAVAASETGIDNFGFDIQHDMMTLIFTSESIDPISMTLNITYE